MEVQILPGACNLPSMSTDLLRRMTFALLDPARAVQAASALTGCDELAALDRILPHNTDVTILPKGKGWLKRSLLAAQPEPANLLAI